MKLFYTTFVLWLVAILRGVSNEEETLLEEPGSRLWYWSTFKKSNVGTGWAHPSTPSPVYAVCDISNRNEEPKNWLRTDYINIKDATRLDIEVAYTLRNCPLANVGPFCRVDFSLYSYHTDHMFQRDHDPDPTRVMFHKEAVITPKPLPAPGNRIAATFYGSIVTKAKGIYLALLDQGACFVLRKFVVRYRFCSETVVGHFIRFPRTIAPINDNNLTKQEGNCTDPNSRIINNVKSFGVCLSDGEWNITHNSACLCNYAYELINGSSDSYVCKECQRGFYKDSVGNEKCIPCPADSASNSDRTGCVCDEGYYRPSNVTDCEVFGRVVINITMVITTKSCTDGKYDLFLLLARLQEVMEDAFAGRFAGLWGGPLKSNIRCGSTTIDLALIFNSKIKEQDVITVLRNASSEGKLGNLTVSAINRTRMRLDFQTGTTEAGTVTLPGRTTVPSTLSTTRGQRSQVSKASKTSGTFFTLADHPKGATGIFTGAVIGIIATVAVAAGIFAFFVWKFRKRNSNNSNGTGRKERTNGETTEEIGLHKTGLEMAEASQSQQYMALDERNRSSSMIDAKRANLPQPHA